jgi:hypothetical protein
MIKIICNEKEKEWLIKALENSEYGCPKVHSLSRCITMETKGCLSSTFKECIERQIKFETR